jgi:mutator protein MutT
VFGNELLYLSQNDIDNVYLLLWSGFIKRRLCLIQDQHDGIHVVAAVLYCAGEVLIFRRGPGMGGAGFWEFPGGKVESGEGPVAALQREIFEEIGIHIQVEEKIGENIHQYPGKKIHLHFYWAPVPNENFVLTEHDAFKYVNPWDLDIEILSAADRPVVEVIKKDPRMKV